MSERRPSAEELFHRCRALPTLTERRDLLATVCGSDSSLRERVERLLAADASAAEPFLQPRPAPAKAEVGEQAGDIVDRYKLLQAIGEGGMGTVWMAEQREPVVRKVALKIVKLGMDTREVVVRFEAERQALALMDHPHIAKVLDGGATATGRPYFVMELVKGVPITDYCDQAKFGLRQRLELFTKVCEAIQHAHHKGVIHRDIKPSNVLVTLHDGVPVPKVIDFGIAKATSAELTKKTLFTQYAQILGTPEYMAPEQAEMSGLDIDTRADVYSLGVLLYELLTGTKPFDVKTALRVGFQELLRTIREDEPPKPSTRVSTWGEASPVAAHRELDVRSWSDRLRGDLDWIVMKALEKDRARRYETANGFAEDVARFLRDEAVLAAPPSAAYRLRKFVHRRRKTVAAVLATAVLLVAGIAGTGWGLLQALHERDRADVARALAETHAGQARQAEAKAARHAQDTEAVAEFQARLLGDLDVPAMGGSLRRRLLEALPSARRDGVAAELGSVNFTDLALAALDANVFTPSIAAIDQGFAGQPAVQARLLQVVGDTMRRVGLVGPARAPVERALALAKQAFGEHDPRTLSVLSGLQSVLQDAGDHATSERIAREVLSGLEQTVGSTGHEHALAQLYLGKALSSAGKWDEALAKLTAARDALVRLDGPDARDVMSAKHSLLVLASRRGRLQDAEQQARELLAQQRRVLGPRHHLTLSTLSVLGSVLAENDQPEAAEPVLREVFEGFRELFGDSHPRTLHAKNALAAILHHVDRLDDAERLAKEAHAEQVRVLGAKHGETLITAGTVGMILMSRGDFAAAERWLPPAVEGLSAVLGPDHSETLTAAGYLAEMRQHQGRLDDALSLFRSVHEGMQRLHGPRDPATLNAANNYAGALWRLGRAAEAVPVFRATWQAQCEVLGELRRETWITRANLGVNLRDSGQAEEAAMHMRAAHAQRAKFPELAFLSLELPAVLAQLGRVDEVVALVQQASAEARTRHAAGSLGLAADLARLAESLLRTQQWLDAEVLLREVVAVRGAQEPDGWRQASSQSALGAALLGQKRFADAEPLLVGGAEALLARAESMPVPARFRVREAVQRVVDVYTEWQAVAPTPAHAELLAAWQTRLQALPSAR